MEYVTCAICGMPVAVEDAELHCVLDHLDVREARRLEGGPPPAPPRGGGGS